MAPPTWFTRPVDEERPGTLNLVYDALDRQVVCGRADDPALTVGAVPTSYAVLLEQTSALGGLLRALGVAPGDAVAVTAPVSAESVVAVLAVARVGATVWFATPQTDPGDVVRDSDASLVVATAAQMPDVAPVVDGLSATRPRAVVVVDPGEWTLDETRDVAWEPALRAGGSDPASVRPVAPSVPFAVVDHEPRPHLALAERTEDRDVDVLVAGAPWTAAALEDLLGALRSGRGAYCTPQA